MVVGTCLIKAPQVGITERDIVGWNRASNEEGYKRSYQDRSASTGG